MQEKYNLKEMLEEIACDEQQAKSPETSLLDQDDIAVLLQRRDEPVKDNLRGEKAE